MNLISAATIKVQSVISEQDKKKKNKMIRRLVPLRLYQPALGRQVPGTCLRSTSSWDSWCCSRHTGCTHTDRPGKIKRGTYDHVSGRLSSYKQLSGLHKMQKMTWSLTLVKYGCKETFDNIWSWVLFSILWVKVLITSFCLSSTDWKYCSFPSWVSSFFFR